MTANITRESLAAMKVDQLFEFAERTNAELLSAKTTRFLQQGKIDELRAKNSRLEDEERKVKLQSVAEVAQQNFDTHSRLAAKYKFAVADVKELRAKLKTANIDIGISEDENAQRRAAMTKMSAELMQLRCENEKLVQSAAAVMAERDAVTAERDAVTAERDAAAAERDALATSMAAAQKCLLTVIKGAGAGTAMVIASTTTAGERTVTAGAIASDMTYN